MLVLRTIELREWIWCLWQRHLVIKGVYFPFFYYKGGLSKTSLIGGVQSSMGISWNGGTPKSSTLPGFSHINNPFIGTPPPHTNIYIYIYIPVWIWWPKESQQPYGSQCNPMEENCTSCSVHIRPQVPTSRSVFGRFGIQHNVGKFRCGPTSMACPSSSTSPSRRTKVCDASGCVRCSCPLCPIAGHLCWCKASVTETRAPYCLWGVQKKVLHRALGLECCWETIYWRNKEFYIILFLQWVPKKGGPNKEFQCTERPNSIFSMHRGSQTKIFDALMVPNQKNRCTEGIKQRFSMHWWSQTKKNRCTEGIKQRFLMHFKGSQTKKIDVPRVSNKDFRCTERSQQRFSMHWGVPNKGFDAIGVPPCSSSWFSMHWGGFQSFPR